MARKVIVILLLVLGVALGGGGYGRMVYGQMDLPFSGQGKDPSEPVDVYVSAMMERLLEGRFVVI